MDEKQLQEIEARANAATPGPWIVGDIYETRDDVISFYAITDEQEKTIVEADGWDPIFAKIADSDFIANSRKDIPALVAALRQAWKEAAKLSDIITGCGFELYQDQGQVGLKLLDDGTIYMPKEAIDEK